MPRPFEVALADLQDHIEELVESTFSDIQSQFLVLPRGDNFVDYREFQTAFEVLRRRSNAFANFTESSVWSALRENSLCFAVIRTMLGMSPPEWADLARSDRQSDVSQGYARSLDGHCRSDRTYISGLVRPRNSKALDRIEALISIAVEYITRGSPPGTADTVHRLDKVDTSHGLESLRHVASQHVPYAHPSVALRTVPRQTVRHAPGRGVGAGWRCDGNSYRGASCSCTHRFPQDQACGARTWLRPST